MNQAAAETIAVTAAFLVRDQAARRTSTIAACLAVLACTTAAAQTAGDLPVPIPTLPPLERPQASETERPRGQLRMGPLRVTPGFTLRDLGVDTNVYNTETDRKQDFTLTAGPGAEATLELGRFRLSGIGDVAYVYYHTYDSERSFNRSISGTAEFWLTRRILLYASDSFRNTRERLNFEVDARARRIDKGIQSGVLIALTRKLTTEIAGTIGERRYDEDAAIDGVKLAETLNVDTRSLATRMAFKLTPLTTPFISVEANEQRYPESPDRDADLTSFVVGAAFRPRALLAGTASLGYQRAAMLNSELDYAGFLANLALRYRPRDATEFGVRIKRQSDSSFEPDHPYSVVYAVGGALRQHLFRRLDLYLEIEREDRTYAGPASIDDPSLAWSGPDRAYRYAATFGVTSVKNVKIGVTTSYYDRSGERVATRAYDGLRVGASISMGVFAIGNRQGDLLGGRQ